MIRLDRMPMTPLRRRFIDDMRLRNLSPRTIETYVTAVVRVAKHFQRSPEQLSAADVRGFQLHLLERRASGRANCAVIIAKGKKRLLSRRTTRQNASAEDRPAIESP